MLDEISCLPSVGLSLRSTSLTSFFCCTVVAQLAPSVFVATVASCETIFNHVPRECLQVHELLVIVPLFTMLLPVKARYPGVMMTLSFAATARFTMEMPFPLASVTGPPLTTAL